MRVQIFYSSRTGNTEKIAKSIFSAVPEKEKNIKSIEEWSARDDGDMYFIGFWTDRGSASADILDLLGELHGKKIALFGTCGMDGNAEYFKQIEHNIEAFIPDDNEYLGAFMCQGKMPMQVRSRYESMRNAENAEKVDYMLRNFDQAILHPDRKDLENAASFARKFFLE